MIMKMGLKQNLLILLLIAASLVSSSFAARCGSSIPMSKPVATDENQESFYSEDDDQVLKREDIHERLLRANTRDYGRPDPTPTFVKPPFKLIPN